MPSHLCPILSVVISSLLIAVTSSHPVECLNVVPDKLYTSATLFLAKDRVTDSLKHFQVEEYVNLKLQKSSTLVRQHWRDEKTQIYYNQLGQNDLTSERKFLMFEAESNSCSDELSVDYWELSILRRVATILNTKATAQATRQRFVDIAVGPSVLLYAIQATLDEFKFKETKLTNSRLAYVDVFEQRIQIETVDDFSELDIKVSIKSRANTARDLKTSNAQRTDQLLSESVKLNQNKLEIASIVACKVPDDASDDDGETKKRPEKADDSGKGKHIPGTLACGGAERVLFHIDYNLVEEYSLASLTGRRIYEQFDYDFRREPFVQPVGIGCWGSRVYKLQKTFTRPSLQFSAEYFTNNGSRGLSYAALDGYSNVMRLDRSGRKSVYDLTNRVSYHIGEFSSAHEANPVDEDVSMEKCLALKIGEETLDPSRAMDRLLGINANILPRHLGTKLIDHIQYEVFEFDLHFIPKFGYNLPILLQPLRYAAETDFYAQKHFYLTFYVHEYPNLNKLSARSQDGRAEQEAVYSVPKFVELWEFNLSSRQKRLINRLVFTQFSWSLDVMPSNDPDTQLHLDNLFNIQQCHQTRATQSELDFYISPFSETKSSTSPSQLEGLKASLSTVEEILHEKLSTILGISRLNIDQLEAKLLSSGQLAVRSRIVELAQGIEYLIPQGSVKFYDNLFDSYIEKIYFNRHSLEECKLDSASWPRENFLAYCGKLTICIILKQDQELSKELATRLESQKAAEANKELELVKTLNESNDLCQVYSFKYLDIFDQHEMKTIKAVEENEYKIAGTRFTFDYKYSNPERDDGGQKLQSATYTGFGLVSHLRLLDPVGAKWGVNSQTMVGLSYTVSPKAFDMNQRLSLPEKSSDTFKHCQLACQMDDFCNSFSVCLRNKKQRTRGQLSVGSHDKPDECVLSSMRFTSSRLSQLASLVRESKKRGDTADQTFQMRVTTELTTSVMVMQRDADCSLHSKDFLSEYVSIFEYLPNAHSEKSDKTGNATGTNPTGTILSNKVKHKSATLEECAGSASESYFDHLASWSTKFTYCPLGSYCFLTGETMDLEQKQIDSQLCRVYDRNYQRFYNSKSRTHMRITFEDAKTKQTLKSKDDQDDKQHLIDSIGEDFRKLNLVRSFWGLSSEECARECNLHKSKCLAFDSCTQVGKKLCILYQVRSPKSSANLPLLASESQLKDGLDSSAVKSIRLSKNELCDHFWLKSNYFSIRLRQLLASEAKKGGGDGTKISQQDSQPAAAEEDKRDELIDSIERKTVESDEKKSETEYKSLNGVEQLQQQSAHKSQDAPDGSRARGGGIQFTMLLIGLLVGCVCTLFKGQIADATASLYQFYLMRRGNGREADSLSQLVLNDQL